jgi:D-serine dehydratase
MRSSNSPRRSPPTTASMLSDPATYSSAQFREVAAEHRIVVGSTGNLGLSIGILGARPRVRRLTVHMSADAREWKKAMLT